MDHISEGWRGDREDSNTSQDMKVIEHCLQSHKHNTITKHLSASNIFQMPFLGGGGGGEGKACLVGVTCSFPIGETLTFYLIVKHRK